MQHQHSVAGYDWANGQYVTYTTSDGDSAVLTEGVYCFSPSTDCWLTMAAAPTAAAAAGSMFVSAGSLFHFYVAPAQAAASFKVSAVQASAAGAYTLVKVL